MGAMDLAISIRFSHLFPPALIGLPRHGILNVHPGSLPQYAGLYAPMRQMVDGQEQIGCTVHWIDDGIDTGPVIARCALPIDGARSLVWHVCHSYSQGVDAVLDIIGSCAAAAVPRASPRTTASATTTACRRRPSSRRFRTRASGWSPIPTTSSCWSTTAAPCRLAGVPGVAAARLPA